MISDDLAEEIGSDLGLEKKEPDLAKLQENGADLDIVLRFLDLAAHSPSGQVIRRGKKVHAVGETGKILEDNAWEIASHRSKPEFVTVRKELAVQEFLSGERENPEASAITLKGYKLLDELKAHRSRT